MPRQEKEVKSVTCNHSIDKQYELGRKIGVTGTPALLLSNGELIPGYVPAARLIPFLDEKLSSPSEDEELHLDE
jgi:thiol:disulfide interchange protein DsbC